MVVAQAAMFSAITSMITNPKEAVNSVGDAVAAADDMVTAGFQIGNIKDAQTKIRKTLREIASQLREMAKDYLALTKLKSQGDKLVGLKTKLEKHSDNTPDDEKKALTNSINKEIAKFVEMYGNFDEGFAPGMATVYTKLAELLGVLCDIGEEMSATKCAEGNRLVAKLDETHAYFTELAGGQAATLAQWARAEVAKIHLEQFKDHIAELEKEIPELPNWASVDKRTDDVIKWGARQVGVIRNNKMQALTTLINIQGMCRLYCASQAYKFGGQMGKKCQKLMTSGEIVSLDAAREIIVDRVSNPGGVTRPLRASIPTFPTGQGMMGTVDLARLSKGETVMMQLPQNATWLRRYGWLGVFGDFGRDAMYLKSLKVFLPHTAGASVRIKVESASAAPLWTEVQHDLQAVTEENGIRIHSLG
eukprot:Sspe_Gene.3685::Locus_1229_Transcript_1_1_Confidence_1.000_Length_6310::g.3685::m.3685